MREGNISFFEGVSLYFLESGTNTVTETFLYGCQCLYANIRRFTVILLEFSSSAVQQ